MRPPESVAPPRSESALEETRLEVERLGGEGLVLPCDVADPEKIEAAAAKVEERFGPIDVWVNNAMASVFSPIEEMTAEEFRRVTEVTYLGYVYGTLSALKRMLPRDRGVIVQVGSALAYRGIPPQSAYCAAKHAIAPLRADPREQQGDRAGQERACWTIACTEEMPTRIATPTGSRGPRHSTSPWRDTMPRTAHSQTGKENGVHSGGRAATGVC